MNRTTRQFVTMFLTAVMFLNLMPALAEAAAKPLSVLSPDARGAELTAPVEVVVRIRNARPDRFRAELNGRDVTHLFGPLNGGTRQAVFTAQHLKQGRNRFEARLGWHRAQRVFRVKSLQDDGGPPPGDGQGGALYVPIQTRIVSGDGTQASDYAIKVGGQTYAAPPLSGGGATGYQFLLLDRQTLALVSNGSVPMNGEEDMSWMSVAANNRQQCGENGCLAVVQSLQLAGWTPRCDLDPTCYNNSRVTPGMVLSNLGGSDPGRIDYADGTTPHTGYSLIANVGPSGASSGSGFERLTCNFANDCGSSVMGAGGMGAISGALILDNNNNYTFTYTGRATFSTGTGASPTSNTITVNGKAYQSETIPENSGAFHMVVVYRDSLELVYQKTFNFDELYSDDPSVWTMSAALADAGAKENYLVLISGIGNLAHDLPSLQWSKVAQGLEALGATYGVFQSLQAGDDYSFVGSAGSLFNRNSPGSGAAEASSVISGATRPAGANPRASNLRGVLAQDNLGNYSPTLTNLTATDQSDLALLDAVGLQPPTPWPAMTAGQQRAYLSISEKLCCADIRAAYTNDNIAPSTWQSDIEDLTYPSGGGFTQEDFDTVKAQLTTEINYVADIRQFYANIVLLYTQMLASQDGILTGAYDAVTQALKPHNSTTISPKWLDTIQLAETLTDDLVSLGGTNFPAALPLDIVFAAMNHGLKSANNQNGAALQNVETTVEQLKEKSINDFNASLTNVGNLFDLILSDWGRLQALGEPLRSSKIQWNLKLNGVALGSIDRAVRREYFYKLMAAAGYKIGQWTDVAYGYPPDLNALYRFTGYRVYLPFSTEWVCQFDTPNSDPENWLTLPTGPTGERIPPGEDGQFHDIFIVGRSLPCDSANDGELLGPLFAPVDDTDPTKLGVYKPYFFLYGPFSKSFNEKCTRAESCVDN